MTSNPYQTPEQDSAGESPRGSANKQLDCHAPILAWLSMFCGGFTIACGLIVVTMGRLSVLRAFSIILCGGIGWLLASVAYLAGAQPPRNPLANVPMTARRQVRLTMAWFGILSVILWLVWIAVWIPTWLPALRPKN